MTRRSHANYLRNIQRKLKTNPKAFWKYVNEQRKESGLPSSMTFNGREESDTRGICGMFSAKFASVFSNEVLTSQQIANAANNVPSLEQSINEIDITDTAILKAAANLKMSSSSGPDGIPSAVLKKCIAGLLIPLRHIYRLSLTTGIFPSLWKQAFIFPVHKKGDKRNVDNYRGISALCAVSKLFELIVMEPVFTHCKQYISVDQHGFMENRSTTTNLMSLTSYVTDGFAKGLQTDVIYTDLSAAFDKINHSIAVAKLSKLGFSGSLLCWLQSYLINRQLKVKIADTTSPTFLASSGIPQGSHLGPLIFLIYFNDVNVVLDGPRLSFADDLKIYLRIKNLVDALFLQRQFVSIANWCECNRMVLNINKCSVISFAMKKKPIIFDYQLVDQQVPRESCVKDLGVYLDEKLTFRQHVTYIVDKASRLLGFIFRIARNFEDVYCLKSLYCSLVRSNLEYCSTVWNPYYQNGVERIEAVQRRFIRFALRKLPWRDPLRLPSYEDRCQLIHLDTLNTRRNLAKAMLISDILTSRVDCPNLLEEININVRPRTLRNNSFLRLPLRRTNYGAYSAVIGAQRFFNRISSVFDFNLSRDILKNKFLELIRRIR